MLLQKFRIDFINKLSSLYDTDEISAIFQLILHHVLHLNRIDLVLCPSYQIPENLQSVLTNIQERLLQHEPIQYILETAHFFGLEFYVSPQVLIPRSETEALVAMIIEDYKTFPSSDLNILDIGTGSGCIPICLASNLKEAKVFGIDISTEALQVAKQNATTNSVEITFLQMDILNQVSLPGKYDVIVSNPPYVRVLEKAEMKSNVLDYEPHLALFVSNEDPLIFYKKIATLAYKHLKARGTLYFEINQYLGLDTLILLKDLGFSQVEVIQDFRSNDRFVKAQK
jgi:release factor glutamine methyltransferase